MVQLHEVSVPMRRSCSGQFVSSVIEPLQNCDKRRAPTMSGSEASWPVSAPAASPLPLLGSATDGERVTLAAPGSADKLYPTPPTPVIADNTQPHGTVAAQEQTTFCIMAARRK